MAINDSILALMRQEELGSVLTLGRQDWCGSKRWTTADAALRDCGATCVKSLDLRAEHPDYVHDLNLPLRSFDRFFDVVFDGGTLEHVFNVPTALATVARLVRVGGVFCSHQLLNLAGHGFYSLTPELFFAWFSANGFTDCRYLVRSKFPFVKRWRELRWEGKRIELTSVLPLETWFRARKVGPSNGVVPMQAGPSVTNRWKFITWEARLWRWAKHQAVP